MRAGAGQTGRCVVVTGEARPDPDAVLGALASGGPGARYAGPGSDEAAAARILYGSPGLEVPAGALRMPGVSPDLAGQSSAWLREVVPGEKASQVPAPRRLGNGLRSALPAVAGCLTSRPGSSLLLLDPETGLHPRGQTAMGGLACRAAAAGVRVTVMTHSDHVFNGIRLAVARGLLPAPAVAIRHYRFGKDGAVIADRPVIGPDGMLSSWPPGLFDEWDRALSLLLD